MGYNSSFKDLTFNNTGNVHINVTLMSVRVPNVVLENKYYVF